MKSNKNVICLKTLKPLYKTVSITRRFKVGPQKCCIQTKMYSIYRQMTIYGPNKKCIDYIEKNDHLYNLYIFVRIQHSCLANTGFALDPSNFVNIKKL